MTTRVLRRQDAIVPAIQRMGGTVLGQTEHATNEIKVRGTPEQIRSLAALPGVVEVKPAITYRAGRSLCPVG